MHVFPRTIAAALAWVVVAGCSTTPSPSRDFSPDAIPDPFRHPTAALSHPLATRSILVSSGGHLFTGEWWTRIEASSDGVEASAPRSIAFEDRWLPVARWTRTAGPMRFDFEAVALPGPGSWTEELSLPVTRVVNAQLDARARHEREEIVRDIGQDRVDRLVMRAAREQRPERQDRRNLLVSLEVRVSHLGRGVHSTRLGLTLVPANAEAPFVAIDAAEDAPAVGWISAHATPGSESADSVLGWSELPARRTRAETAWVLGPGESRVARFVLPAYPTRPAELERWASVSHALRVEEARAYWIAEVARGARIELGDPALESAIRAARVVLLSCRERREGRWVPIEGPFQNRDVHLSDAARAVQALALHGYVHEARELVSSFDEWQWPHGPFVSQKAQLDATGQALWAYEQALLRPTPDARVRHYAEVAAKAVAWCERQRARSTEAVAAAVSWAGDGGPAIAADGTVAGLMPAADPRDHELVRGQLVGTDAWAIAGYRSAAALLEAAGRRDDAAQVRVQLANYRTTFAQALATLGHADVPPSWSGTGLEWGNLAVGYPCRALPASDPRIAALANRYWATAGAVGLGYYGTPSLHHGFLAADLGSWALMAGRREEAEHVLDSLVYWRNASGSGAEMFTGDGDFGIHPPPHPSSAAALLTLARNSLVFDESDTLALTAGARSRWWNGARARALPTRWGNLDLEFRIRAGCAEWRWTPVPVWTALTLPPGTVPRGPLPRPLQPGSRPEVVLVPPGIGRAEVALGSLPVSIRWED